MATIPKRVVERIKESVKRFAPILQAQRDRDVSEVDTVTLVKDLLSDLFGFDKYAEVTSEHAIRGTYCDLAIRVEDKLRFLIEVKAIGLELNDRHTKQCVDYAANQGVDWVVLTNAVTWQLYRVQFKKPIDARKVAEFDLLQLDARKDEDLERVFLITREGLLKGAVADFSEKQQATSRFLLAAVLTADEEVLNAIRRELRKTTEIMVSIETIANVLRTEVIKRETMEGPEAAEATRLVARQNRQSSRESEAPPGVGPAPSQTPAASSAAPIPPGR